MPKSSRFHIDTLPESPTATPKHLSKQEFGRLLYRKMLERGWSQSDLARKSGIAKDSISNYIRGKALPFSLNLQKLADVFGESPADLLPNSLEAAIDEDVPSLEMRVSVSAPNMAWLRVNRLVSLGTAARVVEMINNDRNGTREPADAS